MGIKRWLVCGVPQEDPSGKRGLSNMGTPRSTEASKGPAAAKNVKNIIMKRLKKKNQMNPDPTHSPNMDKQRRFTMQSMRAASYESLSGILSPIETLDLSNETGVIIRPLHSSILGEKHCFEVIHSGGSQCFGCASAAERDTWIDNLRRTVQPNKDNCERVENMLSLWVNEAKDLPTRKKYFCEVHLDSSLYARTTSKANTEKLFWGEHFEFNNLPQVGELTLHVFRDEDRKRKDVSALGSLTIPLAEVTGRQHVEKWYPINVHPLQKGKIASPTVRVNLRYQNIKVLPMIHYKEFAEYITCNYMPLCTVLEPSLKVKDKEEVASALVHILQCTSKAKEFLIKLGMSEVDRCEEKHSVIFRENTLATKAIDEYMKLIGQKYLVDTLGDFVTKLSSNEASCEVDPSKCPVSQVPENQNHMRASCEEVFKQITDSHCSFPAELREIFAGWQQQCKQKQKEDTWQRMVCSSLFLRFLCPAIMSPSLFNLTQEYPEDTTARGLTLIAKVIQNLANHTTFEDKEEYMHFMDGFLESNRENMQAFLAQVSGADHDTSCSPFEGCIDLGLELSTLHSLLCDITTNMDQQSLDKLEPLPAILNAISDPNAPRVHHQPFNNVVSRWNYSREEKPSYVAPKDVQHFSSSMLNLPKSVVEESRYAYRELRAQGQRQTRVQRTQSVPARVKPTGPRKQARQDTVLESGEHGTDDDMPTNLPDRLCHTLTRPPNSLRSSHSNKPGSIPYRVQKHTRLISVDSIRKSHVPWEMNCEQEGGPREQVIDDFKPHEKHEHEISQLKEKLEAICEKQKRFEKQMEEYVERVLRESEDKQRVQLEEKEQQIKELTHRLEKIEEERKKDIEKLEAAGDNIQKIQDLQNCLNSLEEKHRELLNSKQLSDNQPVDDPVPVSPPSPTKPGTAENAPIENGTC
eukprot:gi/632988023/ref/XP_007882881.1/ PREDICTED: disabled homolog 2-interacting protein-like [Callorhinchus milii]